MADEAKETVKAAAPVMPDFSKITDNLLKKLLGAKDEAVQEMRTMFNKAVESFPQPGTSKGSKVFHIFVYLLAFKAFVDTTMFAGTGGGEVILKYADLYLARFALLFKQSYGEAKSLVGKGWGDVAKYFNDVYELTDADVIETPADLAAFLTKKAPVFYQWCRNLKIPGLDEWIAEKQVRIDCLKRQGRFLSGVIRWVWRAMYIAVPGLIAGRAEGWLAGLIVSAAILVIFIIKDVPWSKLVKLRFKIVATATGGGE